MDKNPKSSRSGSSSPEKGSSLSISKVSPKPPTSSSSSSVGSSGRKNAGSTAAGPHKRNSPQKRKNSEGGANFEQVEDALEAMFAGLGGKETNDVTNKKRISRFCCKIVSYDEGLTDLKLVLSLAHVKAHALRFIFESTINPVFIISFIFEIT